MKGEDFILEEDLSENLRTLKPVGNLLRDQYDSVFRKGILEARNNDRKIFKSSIPKYKYRNSLNKVDPQERAYDADYALVIKK